DRHVVEPGAQGAGDAQGKAERWPGADDHRIEAEDRGPCLAPRLALGHGLQVTVDGRTLKQVSQALPPRQARPERGPAISSRMPDYRSGLSMAARRLVARICLL